MSALGQKRTFAVQQLGSLFDHLVGELVKLQRNGEIERVRGSAIYHKMEDLIHAQSIARTSLVTGTAQP
jgi:hypothetical protein